MYTSLNLKRKKTPSQPELAAKILNEFTVQTIELLRDHPVNRARIKAGKKPMNCILARDSGNRYPNVEPISRKYGMSVGCIVDMPVEIGISKVLGINMFQAGEINDYEEKARVAGSSLSQSTQFMST